MSLMSASEKARRGRSRAGVEDEPALLGDAVEAGSVLAFGGLYLQPHLLGHRAADEPANTVGLPASGFHDLGERRSLRTLDQALHNRGLAALPGCDLLLFEGLRSLRRFRRF